MALQFGKNSTRTSSASNPITTAAFVVASDEKVLVLMIKTVGATNRAGGSPSFGGQAMTQANSTQKAVTSPEAGCELWYLLDPPIGSNTCTIPNTGAATIFYTLATARASSSATGSVALDGANGGNATATNPTPGSVDIANYSTIGFAITAGGWTTWAPSAQAGTVIANTDDGAHGGGEQYALRANPGPFNLNWTFATSDDWGAVVAFFSEKPAVSFNNYLFARVGDGMSTGEKIR